MEKNRHCYGLLKPIPIKSHPPDLCPSHPPFKALGNINIYIWFIKHQIKETPLLVSPLILCPALCLPRSSCSGPWGDVSVTAGRRSEPSRIWRASDGVRNFRTPPNDILVLIKLSGEKRGITQNSNCFENGSKSCLTKVTLVASSEKWKSRQF